MRLLADRHIRRLLLTVTVVLLLDTAAAQLICGRFFWPLLLVSVGAAAVILLSCVIFLKKQDGMMEDADRKITRFLSGEKNERIDCDEEGELFRLFQSVNTLSAVLDAQAEREKRINESLKNMISDISHQLKTPLSSLRLYNELIADADDPADVRRFAAVSETELTRTETLVKNLLTLARMDAGAIVFDKHPEDVAGIMEEIRSRFACRAKHEGKTLTFAGGSEMLPCDAGWLTEAFGNIVKNALDHTSAGGCISVSWKRNGNVLNVIFRDDGSGIHPEDIGYIFKRFYRSRFSTDTQGIGLGLPLAKTIIEAHDGMIEADSEPGCGTEFSVSFLIPTES